MPLRPPVSIPTDSREFNAWCRDTHPTNLLTGSGTPEGVVTAEVGTLFLRKDGGASTTLYVKTSGTGSVGWTAK